MFHLTALVTCLALLCLFPDQFSGRQGARDLRREGAGRVGQSGLRAHLSRAGMNTLE